MTASTGRRHAGVTAAATAASVLVGLSVVAAACQPAQLASASPNATAAAASSTPGPEIHLVVLDHQDLHLRAMRELLPRFEAEMAAQHRNIKVDLVEGPSGDEDFRALIQTAYRSANPPDLTSYPGAFVPDFASQGYLLDITDRLKAWPDWSAHFYPALRDRVIQAGGRVFSIPRGANVVQLFYRRDVLEANGVSADQPRTWADLIARMADLRAKTGRPSMLIPGGKSWGGGGFDEGFINLVLGTRSPLYDEASKRWVVRSPGLSSVFAFYETIAKDGVLPVEPLLGPSPWEPTKFLTFPAGDLAVTTQGTWGWTFDWGPNGRAPIANLADKVGTWEFPTEQGDAPFVWAAENWMWTISAKSKHPDETFELLKWLNSGTALATDLTAVGNVAPRDDISDVAPYRDAPFLVKDEHLLTVGRSFKARVGIDKIQTAAAMATDDVIAGRLDAAEAADEFATLATQALGSASVMSQP